MARNDLDQVSVVGFDAPTIEDLANIIQTELIDPNIGHADRSLNIMQQFFFNPVSGVSKDYGAMIYYAIQPKAVAPAPLKTNENPGTDQPKPGKKRK